MKKWTYHHSFGVLALLFFGCWVGIAVMDQVDMALRPASIAMSAWQSISLFSVVTVVVIWIIVFLLKRRSAWWVKALLVILLVMVWLVSAFATVVSLAFSSTVLDHAVFTSPDGAHSICITYEAFLAVEWNDVYVIHSPITMRRVGSLRDGTPLRDCEIVWYDEGVKIVSGKDTMVIPLS